MPPLPAALELQDVPFSDPRVTLRKIPRMLSSKVGLIKSIGHGQYRAQDPLTLSIGCSSADLARTTDIENSQKAGGGGATLEIAMGAAIGEMVERYCMYWYDRRAMVRGAYRDLQPEAVAPDELRLYTREQVANKAPDVRLDYFSDDTRINWVWGYSLTHRRPRLVPATLVYLGYQPEDDDEQVIGRNASSGLAAGATLEEAILSALYELIERDAFTIAWLHQKVGPLVRIDDPALAENVRTQFRIDHPAVDLRIHDITLDIPVTSLFGILRRPTEGGPALAVSSVTRLDPKDAIRKCLREIGQGLPYIRYLREQLKDWEPASDYSDLRTFDHHFTLYNRRPDLVAEALAFCDAVDEEVPLSRLPNRSTGRPRGDIERCTEMLRAIGKEVIVVDIATRDVRDVGLSVVRVLVPGLVPLHGNHNFPYLGVRRLYEVPQALSWSWDPADGFTHFPHPFP